MKIIVKDTTDYRLKEVIFSNFGITYKSEILNGTEQIELAKTFLAAAEELLKDQ